MWRRILVRFYRISSSSSSFSLSSKFTLHLVPALIPTFHPIPSPSKLACPYSIRSFTPPRHDDDDGDEDLRDEDGHSDAEDDVDVLRGVVEPVERSVRDYGLFEDVETVVGSLSGFSSDSTAAKARLENCGVVPSRELVDEALSRLRNDWGAAFTFFLWAGKQPGYAHSAREYHSMISILGKMRRFDTAWNLVEEMKGGARAGAGASLATPQTLMILIRRYCAAHDVAKAINAFYALKRFGFVPGIDDFQGLLSALCRYKNVEDAEHLLFCNEKAFPFETKSFNIILNGWCNVLVYVREAKRFWKEMGKRGIQKDVVSYGSMISCYSKAGNLNDVLKLFNQMKEMGIEADRKVYNAVVYALAKGKCVDEAKRLVKTMKEKGVVPNAVTFNSLIRPLCKAHQVDDAKELFDEMLQRGLSPCIRTYHAFFDAARNADEVFELLHSMKERGPRPAIDTYIMLIRKLSRWKQHDSVFKLWNEMPENGLSPDRSSYIVLIHGLFLNGRLEDASKYYEEMKSKGFSPEPKTEEMIQSWLSSRELVDGLQWQSKPVDSQHPLRKSRSISRRHIPEQHEARLATMERGFSLS